VLECVVNVSEGCRASVLGAFSEAARPSLLDRHSDATHNRSVLSLAGLELEARVRLVAEVAVKEIDLTCHRGVHPRLGVLDVVPFVPLPVGLAGRSRDCGHLDPAPAASWREADLSEALAARDRFAEWAASTLSLPCFLYGPERSLPEIRRRAFRDLAPDFGPDRPHVSAGACCVGARHVLVAYNLETPGIDLAAGRELAKELRCETVRALAFDLGSAIQISCNLLDPFTLGPAEVYAALSRHVEISRAELVGLAPGFLLQRSDHEQWPVLGLSANATIESRLADLELRNRAC